MFESITVVDELVSTQDFPDLDRNVLDLPRQCVSPQSLSLPNGLSLSTWGGLYHIIDRVSDGCHWWLGDWLLYGEDSYGEAHTQELPTVPRSVSVCQAARWVASRISPYRRRPDLSWTHHREVSGLEIADQEKLLERASAEEWTCKRMREEVCLLEGRVPQVNKTKIAVATLSQCRVGAEWRQEDHEALVSILKIVGEV